LRRGRPCGPIDTKERDVGTWWSSLFGVVLLACLLLFIIAPIVGWWMPEGVSTHAGSVDWLFYLILYITGFFFVLTEAILVYFMFKFGGGQKPAEGSGPPEFLKKLIPDQHRLELAWSIVPAAILLIIAFTQVNTWAQVKYRSRMPSVEAKDGGAGKTDTAANPIQLEVSARQFEWRIRYPSPKRMEAWLTKKDEVTAKDFKSFTMTRQFDDIHLVNEIHAIVNRPVVVQLKTLDVIHSFNLPHLRVKQDALPGQTIPVWFTPTKFNTKKVTGKDGSVHWVDQYNPDSKQAGDKKFQWDLACAELCGWGHYRMIGKIYVHDSDADFKEWLSHAQKEMNATKPTGN
jgi:cytochrome c oxidase subunit 2